MKKLIFSIMVVGVFATATAADLPAGFSLVATAAAENLCRFGNFERHGQLAIGVFDLKYEGRVVRIIPPVGSGYPEIKGVIPLNLPVMDILPPELSGAAITDDDIKNAPSHVLAVIQVDGSDRTEAGTEAALTKGITSLQIDLLTKAKKEIQENNADPAFRLATMRAVNAVVFGKYKAVIAAH